jgi:23S rRNA pseudouridine955/2504/2580 synthase
MDVMKTIHITEQNANQRADKFVRKWLNDAPLSFIYKLFRKKDVKVNGKWIPIDYILKHNDVVTAYVNEEQLVDFVAHKVYQKRPLPYPIVYEDDHVLILIKPKGVLVQGEDNKRQKTLTDQVIEYLYLQGSFNPEQPGFTPASAHRLDRNTSGLIVYGKSISGLQALQRVFKDKKQLKKSYYALAVGRVEQTEGIIDLPLFKDDANKMVYIARNKEEGLEAITHYKVIDYYQNFTLLDVQIISGRTHQIRVHLKTIGHPVAGDAKYGDYPVNQWLKKTFNFEDQFLHAYQLSFGMVEGVLSPLAGKTFTSKLDGIEEELLIKLSRL